MQITAQPLTAEAFAPYGDVLSPPTEPGRTYFEKGLKNGRTGAWLDVSRWLVVVAQYGADGGPDPSRAIAFVAGPGQGVTYHMGTWHHGLTALDRPARFAVFMWRDGTGTDEEFRQLAEPFTVQVPA